MKSKVKLPLTSAGATVAQFNQTTWGEKRNRRQSQEVQSMKNSKMIKSLQRAQTFLDIHAASSTTWLPSGPKPVEATAHLKKYQSSNFNASIKPGVCGHWAS